MTDVTPAGVADDASLDIGFYRTFYQDIREFEDADVLLHWERHGQHEGRWPNARAAVLNHRNFNRLSPDFDPIDYVFANRDLSPAYHDTFMSVMHYLEFGIKEGRLINSLPRDDAFVAAYGKAHPRERSSLESADPRLQWRPKNVDAFLYLCGFNNPRFLDAFDDGFYASIIGLSSNEDRNQRHACIIHFAEKGANSLLPIAEDLSFEPSFYRRSLRSFGEIVPPDISDADLYKSWLSRNDFLSVPPNQSRRLKDRFGVIVNTSSPPIDLEIYRSLNRDLQQLDNETLLEHVFNNGILERRSSIRVNVRNVGLFLSFADHLYKVGRTQDSESLCRRLLHFIPNNSGILTRVGDALFRHEDYVSAYAFYKKNIESGNASVWNFLNAVTCCDKTGDFGGALATIAAGYDAYPDDQYLFRLREDWAGRFFAEEFAYAAAEAKTGKISDGQERLARSASRCDFGIESVAPSHAIRTVAIFANMDITQCTLYRVEQKAEQLLTAGFSVRVYNWSTGRNAFQAEMADCDAVIFYRIAAFPEMISLINAARRGGLATFYDVDDLIFDPEHFPEPFEDYAGQITKAEYADIAIGVPLFRYALGLCDYAIASTPSLAKYMEPLVRKRRAFVHRNALGLRHQRAMLGTKSAGSSRHGPVTIFYGSGTKAHKLDFETILLPALREIHRRFGDKVRIVMVGHRPVESGSALYDCIHFEPFTPEVEDYWGLLREADISLSVLRNAPATGAKSEIKWLEAAMFGIPSIVGATDTFVEVIEHGVDGFVASTTSDFIEALSTLVMDERRRVAVGAAARAKAIRDYGMDALAANISSIIRAVEAPSTTKTRVLVVNVFYPPQAKGGATRVVVDNIRDIREMHDEEFEFEIFTTLEGGTDPYTTHLSAVEGVRTTAMVAGGHPDMMAVDEKAGDLFRTCVQRFKPHIIHFHCIQRITASASELAIEAGIPYLITAHDGWWISDKQFLYDSKANVSLYDFTQPMKIRLGTGQTYFDRPLKLLPSLRGAYAILPVSEVFAEIYRGTGLGNVRSLPNGIPVLSSSASQLDRRPRSADDTVHIAHIGGTEAHKGLPLLRRAFIIAKPKNISVTVVELALSPGEEKVDDWGGVPVRVIAKRRQNEMQALYNEIDVLMAPSLWQESFGLVTREALAAGCWVVASDRGAIGEPVVEDVNGHVVSVDTIEGLIQVIKAIDADPFRYKQPPAPGRELRTARDQATDIVALYREMLNRPGDSAS